MRPRDIPRLLDGLFELRQKHKIVPPTPLIIAMDGAGKNGALESYTAERGLDLCVLKFGQAESAGDLLGAMVTEERLPCHECLATDPECRERYTESDWATHGAKEHGLGLAEMRAGLEPVRHRVVRASRFLPPAFLPTSGRGVMVLDEPNRANSMLENAALELLREHRLSLNGWTLPPGWIMVSLANPMTEKFTGVNPMDAATESRVVVLTLTPTADDFVDFARKKKMHPSIIRFVERNPTCLDSLKFTNPMVAGIEPRPRRLEMLSDLARVLDHDLLMECAEGLLGPGFIEAYGAIVAEKEAPLTAEEILEDYPDHQGRLQVLVAEERTDLVDGSLNNLLDALRQRKRAPAKAALANVCSFLMDVSVESFVKFLHASTKERTKAGAEYAYAALRDGFPDFKARAIKVLDQGVDYVVPEATAAGTAG